MEQTSVTGQKMTKDTKKKKKLTNLIKDHKKEIAIGAATACIVAVGVGVGVVIFKNRTAINTLNINEFIAKGLKTNGNAISISQDAVEVCHAWNPPSKIINVSEHLRNLHDGWKASQSKIDLALQYGFSLGDHQTWVNSYAKVAA